MHGAWDSFVEALPRHRKPARRAPIRLVCFDMDGVLVEQQSSWVAVHEHYGVSNEVSLESFLRGEITDEEFIRRDVQLWKGRHAGVRLSDIEAILTQRLRLMPGAKTTLRRLHRAGVSTAIVSGGIHAAAAYVARSLGIPHVSANELEGDSLGRLTGGGRVNTPLRDKAVPVRRFAERLGVPLGHVASVGNSSPDISMFRSSGLAIAFRPTDPHCVQHADATVAGPSLTGILPHVLDGAPSGRP